MAEPSGRRAAGAAVRRALEDAAADLFARQGYGGTTVEDVVAAAGVSKPALYRHFSSKQELYVELVQRHRDELAAAALAGGAAASGGVDDQVEAMIEAWFAYVQDHPSAAVLFRDTSGDGDVEAIHREVQIQQRATDVALLQLYAPGLPEAELEPLGEVIRSSLYGLARLWLDQPDLERSVLVAAMTRMLRGLLATAPDGGADAGPT